MPGRNNSVRSGRKNDAPCLWPAGGLKVLRASNSDRALIVAAGITLHEALKAHENLKNRGVAVRVIDLYSLQPLPAAELARHAGECGGRVVTAEDHYGGTSAELLALMKIDAQAIVRAVTDLLRDE